MSLAVALLGAAFLLGLAAALAVEAWIIRKDRAVAGEPVEGMTLLLLRSVLMPHSCARFYLGTAAVGLVMWAMEPAGYTSVSMLAAFAMWGMPSVDAGLRRLRTGRGPSGRPEPRPLPSRTLADRGRRMAGAALLILLATATVALTAVEGWPAVVAVVVLAAAAGAVAQGLLLPRIVLDGTHLYLYGGRRTTVVPVEQVAHLSGERGITVHLTDGTEVSSTTWARTPGHRHRTVARVHDFVARTRPATAGTPARRLVWERAFPLDLCFAWTCAGVVALALL
ncbi:MULTISPECIES: hypothetical protein [unclassified Nocardiopsis]|uniref:hypothetical protein n=1 Tax=Nocardiopsis TaxID=2013 RepID=UPI00387A8721